MRYCKKVVAAAILIASLTGVASAAEHHKLIQLGKHHSAQPMDCEEGAYCLFLDNESLADGNYTLDLHFNLIGKDIAYSFDGKYPTYGQDYDALFYFTKDDVELHSLSLSINNISYEGNAAKPAKNCAFPQLPISYEKHVIKITGNEKEGYSCQLL